MKLILTFTNKDEKIDFQVNDEMIIKDALKIISDNTDFKVDEKKTYIYSKRNHEKVSVNYNFKQAKIFLGDELVMEELNNG